MSGNLKVSEMITTGFTKFAACGGGGGGGGGGGRGRWEGWPIWIEGLEYHNGPKCLPSGKLT